MDRAKVVFLFARVMDAKERRNGYEILAGKEL